MRFQFNPFTDKLDISGIGPGATSVDFLTGNSGGAVAADAGFNIYVVGDNTSGINTIGNLSPNTLTIFGLASSTTQIGTTRYATNAEAAAQSSGTVALTPSNITSLFSTNYLPSSQGGTGLSSPAAHQLIVTNGSSAYTPLGVASNGQIPIGSIGSDPVLANITSTGGTITVTNGPGTINLELSGGTVGVDSFSPDSGTDPVVPTGAGLINDKGSGSITTVGSLNTITTQLTGMTNHAVLVGAGTTTLTKLAVGSNGQVLIGATAADPAFATLTSSDSSISFTTGANTLSLQVASGTAVLKTLTGNSGGALSPTAGNISTVGTGSITIAGSGSTLTTQLTGLTNHNVLVGAGTATVTNVAPSATAGIPLVSGGSSADPSFTTAVVAGGGTGVTSFTAYAPIFGGTTTTGALQSSSTGQSTSGFVLTSTGASSLPTFQAAAGNVSGPGSSTDRAIATWNGTGGTALFNNSSAVISSAGYATNTSQPRGFVRLNSTISNVSGNNAEAIVIYDTSVIDTASMYNTTNGRLTAPITGTYLICATYLSTTTSVPVLSGAINFKVNGSTYPYGYYGGVSGTALNTVFSQIHGFLALTSGDYVQIVGNMQNTGGAANMGFLGGTNTVMTWCLIC